MTTGDMTYDLGTEEVPSRKRERGASPEPEGLGLVVLWSRDEPVLVGHVALVSGRGAGVFGRGGAAPSSGYRLGLVRQLPGRNLEGPLLTCRRISRDQLRVSRLRGGRLQVENTGRCPMWVGGEPVAQAVLSPGDLVELEGQLLLGCVMRPEILETAGGMAADFAQLGAPDRCGIVGEAPTIWRLRETLNFVAPRPGHVLILGQSGAGKELIARALHQRSPRADRPLISRNAATLPATLMDAELFGHARDYPNAGMPERRGLVGEAEGSTLFLDELGELPAELQGHLLRLMDRGEYQRLGESKVRVADVRLVGATNRAVSDLKADFGARFRHVITAPPLDERREDIPLLITHLLRLAAREDPTLERRFFESGGAAGQPRVDLELVEALMLHPLPLQVRQLDNLLWRALADSRGDRVGLPEELRGFRAQRSEHESPAADDLAPDRIQACLDKHRGVQAAVWRELGLPNRYVLQRLIKKYGLQVQGSEP